MLQEGLYSLLIGEPAITAHVGTPATRSDNATGVFAVKMPEKASMPALVVSQIHDEGDQSHDFMSGFRRSRIQVSCYGLSFGQVKQLATAVRRFLEGWHGVMSEGTEVDSTFLSSAVDTFEEDPFIFHSPLDFEFAYRDGS